ncbi:MAG TPA: hypothetical protein VFV38_18175 [Ktedonobacteraceae bacterium]|nr:hypothetical protein [Ktedonobacteraceae bacterium]
MLEGSEDFSTEQQEREDFSMEQRGNTSDDNAAMQEEEINVASLGPAPFATLTWQRWFEMQEYILSSLSDFLQAMSEDQPRCALAFALNIQEVASNLLDEVYASLVAEGLPALPSDTEGLSKEAGGA